MPFLQTLGYDVFNPLEVVPEYITDIGTKKGEKIDYAIFKDSSPTILIECKHWAQNLNIHDGQLLRYFHVSKAKFGILTNGICYRFYSDLVEPNKMDEKPFLEFNIHEIRDSQIEELKKFHKANFDIDSIVTTASELKFTNELKQLIHLELTNPSETFIKHLTKQVYPGVITAKIFDQFSNLTRRSINQYFNDLITDRLKTALTKETEVQPQIAIELTPEMQSGEENKITTTDEELEAFYIVRAILRQTIDSKRVLYRDAQTYFAILLDDNNRKPICRFYFNGKKKFISTFNELKAEIKTEIQSLDDVYKFADQILATIDFYNKATNA